MATPIKLKMLLSAEVVYLNLPGTGYVNSSITAGSMQFNNINGLGGGTKTVTIRYANGIAAMTGQIVVNGGTPVNITTPTTGGWGTWVTMTVNVTLNNNSKNTIALKSNAQDLGNIDQITISNPVSIYQAENAALTGGSVTESSNAGSLSTGYVNSSMTGGSMQFNSVNGNGGGTKIITIRYAHGIAGMTGQIAVNGGHTCKPYNTNHRCVVYLAYDECDHHT